MRSRGARPGGAWIAAGALAAAVTVAACTGDNLFTGVVLSTQLTAPEVTITAPTDNSTVTAGTPVSVTAQVTSSQGVSQMIFSGIFDAGGTAFTSQTISLPNPKDTTVTQSLAQPGTATGSAKIIVQATDILGATGADTLVITIGP